MAGSISPYIGNAAYCYANATSMLLASVNERTDPALVEVLTGVGLGALYLPEQDVFFFSMEAPDVGISRALHAMGFAFEERAGVAGDRSPVEELSNTLLVSPAIIGPVDMGLLTYMPGRGTAIGADHYVLAYACVGDEVYLHDPAGLPYVSLPAAQLMEAWRADLIGYRRDPFRWWSSPRRIRDVGPDLIVDEAVAEFQGIYRRAEMAPMTTPMLGAAAIRRLSADLRNGEPPRRLREHMVGFVFQLGAKRALDYATFFAEAYPALAEVKYEQAKLFGQSHTQAVREAWDVVSEQLDCLADAEDRFRDALFASG